MSGRGTVEYVGDGLVTLFLCGEVMPGRGVDQILPHPGNPRLREVSVCHTWGSNWGYDVFSSQVRFAHRLIDRGVDVVQGHSSHHPHPIEVYRDTLILYGCGDCIEVNETAADATKPRHAPGINDVENPT